LAFSVILWIIILAWLYVIMLKELKEVYDILIIIFCVIFVYLFKKYLWNTSVISALIWALWIFIFFYLQILFSKWRALWWGDLRIWIMVWLLLGMSYSFIGMFMTYLVWSILSILLILYKKLKEKKKKVSTVVPFGPFIWLWFFITIFFLEDINKLIEIYFGVL
jgi:hypothetical protein